MGANLAQRFNNTAIVSVTAAYAPCTHGTGQGVPCTVACSDFCSVYRNAGRWNEGVPNAPSPGGTTYLTNPRHIRPPNNIGRRIFNYEFFSMEGSTYVSRFNLEGRTNLGGSFTRDNAQRSLNVHMRAGNGVNGNALNGTINYPIWEGGAGQGVHRFRLWNGGNNFIGHRDWSFGSDFMRDPMLQRTARNLNVPYSESRLAIKFINGEFWGFTQLRQQTDQEAFGADRLGLAEDNIVVMDRGHQWDGGPYLDDLEAGPGSAEVLYDQLIDFVTNNFTRGSTPSDAVVNTLFDDWMCKDNFIDYYIINTFYQATDWPQNNVRFFRAITPTNDGNINGDGRWRFILHDMDQAANGITWGHTGDAWGRDWAGGSRFGALVPYVWNGSSGVSSPLNLVAEVFRNRNFIDDFTTRALQVVNNYLTPTLMTQELDAFIARFTPLLADQAIRWSGNQGSTTMVDNFNHTTDNVRYFMNNRRPIYLAQLNDLRAGVGLSVL